MDMEKVPFSQVCIVGGGNAAHTLAALLPSRGIPTVWYVPYADEADRITIGLTKHSTLTAEFASHNTLHGTVRGRPQVVSKHAKDVIPTSDVLLLPVPSFAYASILHAIKDFIQPGTFMGITPGQGGFDWIVRAILGTAKMKTITCFAILPMPFNCRITEFGHHVHVQSYKQQYRIGVLPEENVHEALNITRMLLGPTESVGPFLNCILYPINAVMHPARLYRLCEAWSPHGPPLLENPLFYESMDTASTRYMEQVSQEVMSIADALTQHDVPTTVPHLYEYLTWVNPDVKADNLLDFFVHNAAYKGFRCPFTAVPGGWIPDLSHRYFTEDIPLGLCCLRALRTLVR